MEVACDRSSLLSACVAEAVRLRAPGVAVRMAACDLDMPAGQDTTVRVKKVLISLHVLQTCILLFPLVMPSCKKPWLHHEFMLPHPTIVEWLALAFPSVNKERAVTHGGRETPAPGVMMLTCTRIC